MQNHGSKICNEEPKKPDCPKCNDTEFIGVPGTQSVRFCECHTRKKAEAIIKRTVPELFRGIRVKDLAAWDVIEGVLPKQDQEVMIESIRNDPLGSHFFCGPSGVGKSRFLYALYQEALFSGVDTFCSRASKLADAMTDNKFKRLEEDRWGEIIIADQLIDRKRPLHIFIDEFEKIPDSDFVFNMIFEIVDVIYENPSRARLSLCTNLTPKFFIDRFGEALYRRICNICTIYKLWRSK